MERKCDYCNTTFKFTTRQVKIKEVTEEDSNLDYELHYSLNEKSVRVIKCPACEEDNRLNESLIKTLSTRHEQLY